MAISTKTRWPLFSLGVVAILISLGALIGSYTREIKSTDYIQQAREAAPWIFWGFGSAVAGTCLCSFGKGLYRTLGIWVGAALIMVWLLLGGTAV